MKDRKMAFNIIPGNANDYDIMPNLTYATANNTELKLDLYLPRVRSAPKPTLILFHGGGWVAGQKERNVLWLLPYLSMGWAWSIVSHATLSNRLRWKIAAVHCDGQRRTPSSIFWMHRNLC
jgi:acetyl esterase/lipase